jgi:hypothetical protein
LAVLCHWKVFCISCFQLCRVSQLCILGQLFSSFFAGRLLFKLCNANRILGEKMSSLEIEVREELYLVEADFTEVTEFGVSMQAFLTQEVAPPPQGLRFDVAFNGTIKGERLNGTIHGVDYLQIRADGRAELHIHGVITTEDGAIISFFAGGLGRMSEGGMFELREHPFLSTADPKYLWLNELAVWAVGEVDIAAGAIRVKGYAV